MNGRPRLVPACFSYGLTFGSRLFLGVTPAHVKATLNSPNGPLHGQPVQIELAPEALRFTLDGAEREVSYASLQVAMGGWDGRSCELSWEDAGQWLISQPMAEATWLKDPPEALAAKVLDLTRIRKKKAIVGGCGSLGIMTFLVGPLVALVVFWFFRTTIGSWAVGWVSPEREAEFGEQLFKSMRPQLSEVKTGAAVDAVTTIGNQLTKGSVYRYKWHVVEDRTVNAFAIPGGHVVVHSGLIEKAKSAEELAGVLAHEVQHVELRHSVRGVAGDLLWQILLGMVWDSGSTLGAVAGDLGSLAFSREDESEADAQGLTAMAKAGMNPQGMLDVMKMLATEAGGLELSIIQTHPATQERLATLETLVKKLPGASYSPLPLDWKKVTASLSK
jgi:beta-barrel assembly-enhancing protease